MTFKAKSAKRTVIPLLAHGWKIQNPYKYLEAVLYTELSDDKDIQRQLL